MEFKIVGIPTWVLQFLKPGVCCGLEELSMTSVGTLKPVGMCVGLDVVRRSS